MQAERNKRRGLRKLECECGASVYITFAQAERYGLPLCGCGSRFMPDDLELAAALGVDSPVLAEYRAELSSVMHGQSSHLAKSGAGARLRQPESIAAERVERSRRERARSNRLGALLPAAEPMPF